MCKMCLLLKWNGYAMELAYFPCLSRDVMGAPKRTNLAFLVNGHFFFFDNSYKSYALC